MIRKEWIPLHLREKLSFIHMLGIASSNLAVSILWMVAPSFLEPLSKELHVSQTWKIIILFLSSFAGFAICPIVGLYSDRCTFKWGRRRIYILISLLMILFGLIVLTYCSEIGKLFKSKHPNTIQQIIFITSYLFVIAAGNILQTPARSICTDVTPLHQQNLMANICSVFSGLGGLIVNIIGGLKLEKYAKMDQLKFILLISAILCCFSVAITIIVTPEEKLSVKPPKIHLFGEMWKSFLVMPKPMAHVLPSLLLYTMSNFQFSIEFNHFMGKDIYHGDNSDESKTDLVKRYNDGITWSMICGAVRYGSQVLYGFICTKISEHIGFKWTSFFGYLVEGIGLILFFFVKNRYAFLLIAILPGIGYGTAQSVPYSIASISAKMSNQDIGIYFGILIVFTVIGEQCSNLGIGMCLNLIWPDNPRMMIAISSVIAVAAVLSSLWIIEPVINKPENYESLTTYENSQN